MRTSNTRDLPTLSSDASLQCFKAVYLYPLIMVHVIKSKFQNKAI